MTVPCAHVPHSSCFFVPLFPFDRPEDSSSAELRRDLFETKDSGENAEGVSFLHSLAFQLFPVGLIVGLAVAWYVKKMERRKTGRHKKIDH